MSHVANLNRTECVGCGLCVSVCKRGAISLCEEDDGFAYPRIDTNLCVNCHSCEKNCIVQKKKEHHQLTCKAMYAARARSMEVRRRSSSGGVFYSLAQKVLKNGGVVYGARIDEFGEVRHISVETLEILNTVLGSKYVQSTFQVVFDQLPKLLQSNRQILICGTPCQIAAVRRRFGTHPNLILVDFLCHGVGSPKVFQAHLKEILRAQPANEISFRSKSISWKAYGVKLTSEKKHYFRFHRRDRYMSLYLQNLVLRKSCYDCRYLDSEADIRLGDFWETEYIPQLQNTSDGVSKVYVYTEQGSTLLQSVEQELETIPVDLQDMPSERHIPIDLDRRKALFEDLEHKPFRLVAKKYIIQPSMKVRVYRWLNYRRKEVINKWIE